MILSGELDYKQEANLLSTIGKGFVKSSKNLPQLCMKMKLYSIQCCQPYIESFVWMGRGFYVLNVTEKLLVRNLGTFYNP